MKQVVRDADYAAARKKCEALCALSNGPNRIRRRRLLAGAQLSASPP